jgi:histidinol-phosphate phosphatase family protein
LTDHVPKFLVPVGGRPLFEYWVELLAEAGVTEAGVNTHAHAAQVRDYLGAVNRRGRLRLTEFHEPRLLGSAGTLAANPAFADDADEVLIIYADNLSDVDLARFLAFHEGHGDPLSMLLFHAPDPSSKGIARLDAEGRIVSFVEKPRQPESDLANGGLYAVSPAAYREIAALGAFDLGFDVLPRFVGRMRGWVWEGCHRDIGTLESLAEAESDLRRMRRPRRRPAVFLDRDGTLIEHVHYLTRPDQVRLLPGSAAAVARLRAAGYACVVVTNQSAVGRGLMTEDDLRAVHAEMVRQLEAAGATLDGIYHCAVVPVLSDRSYVEHPDRKPGPGMLLRAAADLHLDISASWMVGDMLSDLVAGRNAGCRGSLWVRSGLPSPDSGAALAEYLAAEDLAVAANLILSETVAAAQTACRTLSPPSSPPAEGARCDSF